MSFCLNVFLSKFQSVMYARSMKISKKLDESVAHSIEVGHEQFMEDLRQQSIGNKWRNLFEFFFQLQVEHNLYFLELFSHLLRKTQYKFNVELTPKSPKPCKSRTLCGSECFCQVFFDIRYKFDLVHKDYFLVELNHFEN
jgi:hypothetical protein